MIRDPSREAYRDPKQAEKLVRLVVCFSFDAAVGNTS